MLNSFLPLANCGPPPPGVDINIAVGGLTSDQTGVFVANEGATASYSCSNAMMLFPMGMETVLTCVTDSASATWSPAEAPACELGKYNTVRPWQGFKFPS